MKAGGSEALPRTVPQALFFFCQFGAALAASAAPSWQKEDGGSGEFFPPNLFYSTAAASNPSGTRPVGFTRS